MSSIMCGFSQKIISPSSEGIFMDGYGFRLAPANKTHDDLYVKTVVFKDASEHNFAIITMDNLGLNPDIYQLLTDYIQLLTGYPKEQFSLCSIHSHSAPAAGILDGLPINYDYWCQTAQTCAESILEAEKKLCKCAISASISDKELLSSVNRRNRPYNDRRIKVITFSDEHNVLQGAIASANCHPVINTTQEISADYPQVLTRESLKKYDVPFLFLLGRSADINPEPDIMNMLWDGIEKLGTELADGIFHVTDSTVQPPLSAGFLLSTYKNIKIPMKPFPSLTQMKENLTNSMGNYKKLTWSKEKHYALRNLEWHRKMYHLAEHDKTPHLYIPIQIFLIDSSIIFIFLPFEIFTITGNKIESFLLSLGYKAENIFVISCSNSVNGYLPPVEEFPIGGYEISDAAHWYGTPEFCEASEPAIIEAVKSLVLSVKS